jgi:hypothetical protein
MQVIIFKNQDGSVGVMYPMPEFIALIGIDAIAKKDVPAGRPYKIVDISELPTDDTLNEAGIPNIDKSFRNQWDVDDVDLDSGQGLDYGNGSHWQAVAFNENFALVEHDETHEQKIINVTTGEVQNADQN